MFAVFVFRQITGDRIFFTIMLDCVDSFACVRFYRDMYSQWESHYYKLTWCKKFQIVVLILVWRVKRRHSLRVKLQQHVQRHASATNRYYDSSAFFNLFSVAAPSDIQYCFLTTPFTSAILCNCKRQKDIRQKKQNLILSFDQVFQV